MSQREISSNWIESIKQKIYNLNIFLLPRRQNFLGYRLLRLLYGILSWFGITIERNVARIIIIHNSEILLIKNIFAKDDEWVLPGGGIERDENPEIAARREIQEELGINLNSLILLEEEIREKSGFKSRISVFESIIIGDKPMFTIDQKEIFDAGWFPISGIIAGQVKVKSKIVEILKNRS